MPTPYVVRDMFSLNTRKTARQRQKPSIKTELIVDNFAGGGGASMGIEAATGRAVDIAINHDEQAVQTHEFNHPATKHFCESVWVVDPIHVCGGRPVGLAWFSPDCRHFSRAKGRKPVSRKIRCLAWIVIRWARKKKPRIIMLENVREFLEWGPLLKDENGDEYPDPDRKGESFKRWFNELKRCGYKVEFKVLNAADYGAPTHRRRLFVIARCDGKPIKWPKPTHGPGRKQPYRTAAECIDWSLPCPSIFDRKKPLAEKTLRRIALGVMRYVVNADKPFIVKVNHGGAGFRGQSLDEPMATVTATHGTGLVAANLARIGQTGGGDRINSVEDPLTTITSKAEHLLTTASLVQVGYGERKGQAPRVLDIEKPLGTVVSGGGKHGLVSALLTKHYGGVVGHEVDKPLGTITQVDHHSLTTATLTRTTSGAKFHQVYAFMTKFFGTAIGAPVDEPMHTITTKERFSLITVKVDGVTYAIADIGMRMLQPHELAKAQGFPDDYVLVGSKSNQVAKIGNSVPPQLAHALVKANWSKA